MDSKLHKAEKPTPEEFIKYIIKTAKSIGPYALDNHIKPIWASCPFCSVEFDIVGHLEDFSKDSAFIHVNMDLMVRLITYLLPSNLELCKIIIKHCRISWTSLCINTTRRQGQKSCLELQTDPVNSFRKYQKKLF